MAGCRSSVWATSVDSPVDRQVPFVAGFARRRSSGMEGEAEAAALDRNDSGSRLQEREAGAWK